MAFFFLFYFYVVASVQRRPLLCRGGGLVGPRLPSRVGRRVAFLVGFATRTVWRFPFGSLPDGGKGGFVLWCCAVAGLSWLGLSCLAILAPHLTVLLFQHTSLLFRPPYIITCTSRYWTRTHREVPSWHPSRSSLESGNSQLRQLWATPKSQKQAAALV